MKDKLTDKEKDTERGIYKQMDQEKDRERVRERELGQGQSFTPLHSRKMGYYDVLLRRVGGWGRELWK